MKEPEYQTRVIQDIARKYNLSEDDARAIIYSPFQLVHKVIKEGTNEKILINNFFKFHVLPGRIKKLTCNKNETI